MCQPMLGKRDQRLGELGPQVGELVLVGTGFREAGRAGAVGVADELQQHLGADDLHRVRDGDADAVQPAQGGELGVRPLPGDGLEAETRPAGDRAVHARLASPPAFQVARVAVEHPVLGVPVPFRGEQA